MAKIIHRNQRGTKNAQPQRPISKPSETHTLKDESSDDESNDDKKRTDTETVIAEIPFKTLCCSCLVIVAFVSIAAVISISIPTGSYHQDFVKPATNYYHILELQPGARDSDIVKQYHHLSRKYHPDRCRGQNDCKKKFIEVSEAYLALTGQDRDAVGIESRSPHRK
ncbi:hypothetical protein BLNAU_9223 [Blattamonas nauphoetae]|uniref:J domain-containing protein n=1 Tax=Blattamonas nauphoetae TaxID=2049346 RepID=A0ABQ9XWL1_9EUKA|nr:hypothetical protein BLNAU_9223 [Blattamonas nauphoetae]